MNATGPNRANQAPQTLDEVKYQNDASGQFLPAVEAASKHAVSLGYKSVTYAGTGLLARGVKPMVLAIERQRIFLNTHTGESIDIGSVLPEENHITTLKSSAVLTQELCALVDRYHRGNASAMESAASMTSIPAPHPGQALDRPSSPSHHATGTAHTGLAAAKLTEGPHFLQEHHAEVIALIRKYVPRGSLLEGPVFENGEVAFEIQSGRDYYTMSYPGAKIWSMEDFRASFNADVAFTRMAERHPDLRLMDLKGTDGHGPDGEQRMVCINNVYFTGARFDEIYNRDTGVINLSKIREAASLFRGIAKSSSAAEELLPDLFVPPLSRR